MIIWSDHIQSKSKGDNLWRLSQLCIGVLYTQSLPIQTFCPGGRQLKAQEVNKTYEAQEVPETYKIPKIPTQGYVNSSKSWQKETPSLQIILGVPGM